ncbi:MAG: RsmD family RNA methyltransferase, partial [Legionellaceae bacterium]|nr:RsmD family RNA methyltransferase [Legionellaceae bacterium]
QLKTHCMSAFDYLQNCPQPFDIIFLDPPFQQSYLEALLPILLKQSILKAGGLVYLESEKAPHLDPLHWETLKTLHAGQVFSTLARKL